MSFALIVEPLLHLGLTETCLSRENAAAASHQGVSVECAQQNLLHLFAVAEPLGGARHPEFHNNTFLSAKLLRRYIEHAIFVDDVRVHF